RRCHPRLGSLAPLGNAACVRDGILAGLGRDRFVENAVPVAVQVAVVVETERVAARVAVRERLVRADARAAMARMMGVTHEVQQPGASAGPCSSSSTARARARGVMCSHAIAATVRWPAASHSADAGNASTAAVRMAKDVLR